MYMCGFRNFVLKLYKVCWKISSSVLLPSAWFEIWTKAQQSAFKNRHPSNYDEGDIWIMLWEHYLWYIGLKVGCNYNKSSCTSILAAVAIDVILVFIICEWKLNPVCLLLPMCVCVCAACTQGEEANLGLPVCQRLLERGYTLSGFSFC